MSDAKVYVTDAAADLEDPRFSATHLSKRIDSTSVNRARTRRIKTAAHIQEEGSAVCRMQSLVRAAHSRFVEPRGTAVCRTQCLSMV